MLAREMFLKEAQNFRLVLSSSLHGAFRQVQI